MSLISSEVIYIYNNKIVIEGTSSFAKQVTSGLQEIESTNVGQDLMKGLSDQQIVRIYEGKESQAYHDGGNVEINISQIENVRSLVFKNEKKVFYTCPLSVGLFHELTHSLHFQNGIFLNGAPNFPNHFPNMEEQITILGIGGGKNHDICENTYRTQKGLPSRISHFVSKFGNGTDPYDEDQGYTRLHEAAQKATGELEYLLNTGRIRDVDIFSSKCKTPLHYAAKYNPEAVPLLIQKGADVDIKDMKGETPIDKAKKANNPEVVKYLMNHSTQPHS